jgi:IMP dehydrogenase
MIGMMDKDKFEKFPNACVDANGSLRVAAAVGTGSDHYDRVAQLIDEGVDAIIVDTAHGHSKAVTDMVTYIRRLRAGHLDVIAGNIATGDAALALIDAGADAVKVGIGSGSICTTRIVAGIGMPQITAIMNVADACSLHNIPLIADGGMRMSGDLVKALAAGASSLMMGSLLAGTNEAPGEIIEINSKKLKAHRGMGSTGAMNEGSADRYGQAALKALGRKLTPEGVEAYIAYKGALNDVIDPLLGGIRAGMGYTGCATIDALRTTPYFTKITNAGLRESHPHSLDSIKSD